MQRRVKHGKMHEQKNLHKIVDFQNAIAQGITLDTEEDKTSHIRHCCIRTESNNIVVEIWKKNIYPRIHCISTLLFATGLPISHQKQINCVAC